MEIYLGNQELEEICASESSLIKHFGKISGKKINWRLCTLCSAPSIADLSTDPPDSLKYQVRRSGYEFAIGTAEHGLVFFKPIRKLMPSTPIPESFINIKEIKITKIEGGL